MHRNRSFLVTFSLANPSPTVIALSKYDIRYFRDIQGPCIWNIDFIIAKEGEKEALAESSYSFFYTRSVSIELNLEAGNYVILVGEVFLQLLRIFITSIGKIRSCSCTTQSTFLSVSIIHVIDLWLRITSREASIVVGIAANLPVS